MKEATKILLSLRPNSEFVQAQPKKQRGAKLNKCFNNAALFSANNKEYSVVSGWLVGDNFHQLGTVFVPHYWLIHTPSGSYFDTSPTAIEDIQDYEYVKDMDIYRYLNRTSYVPPPVILREDGSLQVRLSESHFVDVTSIDIEHLYSLVRI
jgi:hypothetical protein